MSKLDEEFAGSSVVVHPERYAYLKAEKFADGDHFLVSKDADEVTIVTKEENLPSTQHLESTKWFTLYEVKPKTPFLAVGFIAKMTSALAEKGLNVLVVSTYSKDYLLTKVEHKETTTQVLKSLGLEINKK